MALYETSSYALAGEYVHPGPPYAMPLANYNGRLSISSKNGIIEFSELYNYVKELYGYVKGFHLIHEETLKNSYNVLRQSFKEHFKGHVKVLWAVKSLPVKRVLKILAETELDGVDVASPQEAQLASHLEVPMSWSTYTSPLKNEYCLTHVLKLGIIDIVDSLDELALIEKLVRKHNLPKPKIGIRVNPELEVELPHPIFTASPLSKFGVPLNYVDKLATKIKELGFELKLIHLHIGSQIPEPGLYKTALVKLSKALKNLDFNALDIGGGLPFNYMAKSQWLELAEQGYAPKFKSHISYEVDDFAKEISQSVRENFSSVDTLLLEPGRVIVAGAVVTCGEVLGFKQLYTKQGHSIGWVISTVSVSELHHKLVEPDLFHHIILADRLNEEEKATAGVGGDLCFTGDVITPTNVFLRMPMPKPGECMCVVNTGAYSIAGASNFHRTPRFPILSITEKGDILIARKPEPFDPFSPLDL